MMEQEEWEEDWKTAKGGNPAGRFLKREVKGALGSLVRRGAGRLFRRKALAVLCVLLVLAAGVSGAYEYYLEERGSLCMFSLDPEESNPNRREDGLLKAVALTENQALIEAWYRYQACDSHRKCFVDAAGTLHTLQFLNREECGDFTMLRDLFQKEDLFYLSPQFLKIADERLHREEFYYPENLVKPVYAKVLPKKDQPDKRYITALPLVDDGSDAAKALREGTALYAPEEPEASEEEKPEKGSGALLAESKHFARKAEGERTYRETDRKEPGVWDYGLGSLLQYEAMEKQQVIDCAFTYVEVHLHEVGSDGETHCNKEVVRIPVEESDTQASLSGKIAALNTGRKKVAAAPDASVLRAITAHGSNHRIPMKVEASDERFLKGPYQNPTLEAAFGNRGKTHYPIRVPVLTAAATFSGNLRYTYTPETTRRELAVKEGEGSFFEALEEDCTALPANGEVSCIGRALFAGRRGEIVTTAPGSVPEETAVPVGLRYYESFTDRYRAYVPQGVRTDMQFQKRMHEKQDGPYEGRLDADGDGVLTHLDVILNLGFLRPKGGISYTGAEDLGYLPGGRECEEDLYRSMGLTRDRAGDELLLAKVIASEAGPNKLDQLMVASVVMNRIYDARFPDTMMGVLTAPGQYESFTNGRIGRMHPTEEMRSSARAVMDGAFSVPSNVLFQKAGKEGQVYAVVVNGAGFYTHIYSIPRGDFRTAQTDRFGRTAPPAGNLPGMAAALCAKDRAEGIGQAGGGVLKPAPEGNPDAEMHGEEPLYELTPFQMSQAMDTLSALLNPNRPPGLLGTLASFPSEVLQTSESEIRGFFDWIRSFWAESPKGTSDDCFYFRHVIAKEEQEEVVLQTLTFLNRKAYSDLAKEVDLTKPQFYFLGKEGAVGTGSAESIPADGYFFGVETTVSGLVSPTDRYYPVLRAWKETTGFVLLALPPETEVKSVGNGRVEGLSKKEDGSFSLTLSVFVKGRCYQVTYGNLSRVLVKRGDAVTGGLPVGLSGGDGLRFSLTVDGIRTDPMTVFYQAGGGGEAAFVNLLNERGFVDFGKKEALERSLQQANDSSSFRGGDTANALSYLRLDSRHRNFLSRYVGECTWWAYGRGRAYAESKNTAYPMHRGYGNGGDYYDRVQQYGDYRVGKRPRAGSWICWQKPGGYGHVAFVEAVEKDGSIWISESYRRVWDRHDGHGIRLRKIEGPGYVYSASYRLRGFIYLDLPLDS